MKNYKPKLSEYEQHEMEMIKKRNYNESFQLITDKSKTNLGNILQDKSFLGKKREGEKPSNNINAEFSEKDTENSNSKKIDSEEFIDYDKVFNINSVDDAEIKNLLKEKDRLERDLLDRKLKEKDTDKNKRGKTLENPLLAKINLSDDEKIIIANQLRKMSRYAYLKTRTTQQLDLWKRRLEDEQKLFGGVELTEEEIRLNEINQKIFDLASKKLEEEPDQNNKYKMPDGFEDDKGKIDFDKKYKVLYERYKEQKKEEKEDDVWEKQQKVRSLPKYGALNVVKPSDKYSLVLDNQIDFVQKEVLEGFITNKYTDDVEKGTDFQVSKNKIKTKNDEGNPIHNYQAFIFFFLISNNIWSRYE